VLKIIKQDWKHLVTIIKKSESLRDLSTSEEYTRWRNLTLAIVPMMPHSEARPLQVVEEPIKKKSMS